MAQTINGSGHKDNQNLQNAANQRSEELKSSKQTTSSGETSSSKSQTQKSETASSGSDTNVDGNSGSLDRDVETFESPDRNMGARVGDDRDARNH